MNASWVLKICSLSVVLGTFLTMMLDNIKDGYIYIYIFLNPLKTRQNLAEILRNELCHPLHNQKEKYPCFFFCRLQLFITYYLNK